MSEPTRLKDSADDLTGRLFAAGRPTAPLPSAARLRAERRVSALAAAPVVVFGIGLWSKVVAASFGVGFASALALVSVSPSLKERLGRPPAGSAHEAPVPRPSEQRTPSTPNEPASAAPPSSDMVDSPEPSATATTGPAVPQSDPARAGAPAHVDDATPRAEVGELQAEPTPPEPTASSATLAFSDLDPPSAPPSSSTLPAGMSVEVLLLSQARLLVSSDPNRALDLLNEHARRFPSAALGLEREVLVIEALRNSGRSAEASERARELLAASPNALYAARLRRVLGEKR